MTNPHQAPRPAKAPADDERISLAGHDPEDVLRALLKVDPDSEPAKLKPKPKRPKAPPKDATS